MNSKRKRARLSLTTEEDNALLHRLGLHRLVEDRRYIDFALTTIRILGYQEGTSTMSVTLNAMANLLATILESNVELKEKLASLAPEYATDRAFRKRIIMTLSLAIIEKAIEYQLVTIGTKQSAQVERAR